MLQDGKNVKGNYILRMGSFESCECLFLGINTSITCILLAKQVAVPYQKIIFVGKKLKASEAKKFLFRIRLAAKTILRKF
jgi:hypothetical protein